MKRSEALKKAQAKYEAKIKTYHFRCNPETEKDIVERLDKIENKNAYIKALIRQEMQAERSIEL